MTAQLPTEIRKLLADRIDSFEKLELVVALHRAPRGAMSVDDACRVLKLSLTDVREAVVDLRAASLVQLTSSGELQLLPPTSRDVELVVRLVELYEADRFMVVKTLGEIAVGRIRNMASRAFADAFVIRKKDRSDG